MKNIAIGDGHEILPIGDDRYSISIVELGSPISVSKFTCEVGDSLALRARSGKAPDGGIDAACYCYYKVKLTGAESYNKTIVLDYCLLHDRVRLSDDVVIFVADHGRIYEVIAVYNDDLYLFSGNIRKMIRKRAGWLNSIFSMKFAYCLAIEYLLREYSLKPKTIYSVTEDKDIERRFRYLEPSPSLSTTG